MNRRFGTLILLCLLFTASIASAAERAQPNILPIMSDDLGYHDLVTNPTELAGKKALKSQEKKAMLSKNLDAWLEKVKKDAKTLTPKH